jgi:predicted nuclease with TOPRIM domain
MENMMKTAVESYQNEMRFHRICDKVAACVMSETPKIDPEHERRDLHDAVTRAAILTLQSIYNDDAEINALRHEIKALRSMVEQSVKLSARPIFMPAGAHPLG